MSGVGAPVRRLVLRTLVMPADMNSLGGIFGGWLLGQMDMAAGMAGSEHARRPVATVAINDVRFIRKLMPGEILEGYTTLQRVGRTSMTLRIEMEGHVAATGWRKPVADAIFTMVALDEHGQATPVAHIE